MKSLKFIMTLSLFFFFGMLVTSCNSKDKSNDTTQTEQSPEQAKDGKEYTSAFICPMHCKDSGSAESGECPVCGMDYVENKNYKADGHSHEGHDHDGHDHEGHDH